MPDRALHIGIDGRELVGKPTGVGRYLLSILRVWAADLAAAHRYTIFLPSDPPEAVAALGSRFACVVDRASRAGTLWEQTRLRRAVTAARPDVFFAAGSTAPLRLACPIVVAIYDVSFFARPEWFAPRERVRRRWLTRAAARRARAIVTISRFSAEEIVRWLGVPATKIRVARPAAPDVRRPPRLPIRRPVVLYVGSLFNRRRIPDLLRAFALTVRRVPDARLLLVGDNRTNPRIDPRALAVELGIEARVEWRDYVDDAELEELYWSARVFAFLSDYEGFGMTPLEALAHDVPSVLLDTPVAREIYGDGARLVPPDEDAIAQTLTTLLSDDQAHADLVAAGRRRLAAFSWPETAAVVRATLEEAANQ